MADKVIVTMHFQEGKEATPKIEFAYPKGGKVSKQAVSNALQRAAGNLPAGDVIPGSLAPGEHVGTITVRRNNTAFGKGLGVELNVIDPAKLTPVELGKLLVEVGARLQREQEAKAGQ